MVLHGRVLTDRRELARFRSASRGGSLVLVDQRAEAVATVVLVALLIVSGLQLLLFAMWFDMEYNRDRRA